MNFAAPALGRSEDPGHRLFVMHTDKGLKMLYGLARARQDRRAYVMFLDADDLVSNRLAGFVADHHGHHGWYFEKGYRLNESTPPVLFWRHKFYHECGSSYILRGDLAPFPDQINEAADLNDYFVRRYVVHAYVKDDFERRGKLLSPLPFYGAIYTFNGQNFFANDYRKKDGKARAWMRNLVKSVRISDSLREEFGLV
ncbi:MAG: hypothetical protein ACO3ZG_08405 [Kiritimatiellia bacterium]